MPNRTTTKSAYIRSLGNIPAKEAVAKGRASGIKFSENYVYKVRRGSSSKSATGGGGGARRGRPPTKGLHASIHALSERLIEAILEAVRDAIRSSLE